MEIYITQFIGAIASVFVGYIAMPEDPYVGAVWCVVFIIMGQVFSIRKKLDDMEKK